MRGTGGEEKVLKNAKDACATEALEIATYTAIERLARAVGDDKTAEAGRLDPRRRGEDARARPAGDPEARPRPSCGAEVEGEPSYDVTDDRARPTRSARPARRPRAARKAAASKRTARQARKVPGRRAGRGRVKGAVASADDLAIARYDELTADEIVAKLSELSQVDLAKVDAYERKHQNRTTVLERDQLAARQRAVAGLRRAHAPPRSAPRSPRADEDRAKAVRAYERAHKNRAGVLSATERELANA